MTLGSTAEWSEPLAARGGSRSGIAPVICGAGVEQRRPILNQRAATSSYAELPVWKSAVISSNEGFTDTMSRISYKVV